MGDDGLLHSTRTVGAQGAAIRVRGHKPLVENRFRDGTPYWAFRHEFLVVCPKCAECARVAGADNDDPYRYPRLQNTTRLVCTACGLVKQWDGTLRIPLQDGDHKTVRPSQGTAGSWVDVDAGRRTHVDTIAGSDRDPYFSLSLWLRGDVRGHALWAHNEAHLTFLEGFVGAKLREGYEGVNKTMGAHLPEWMKTSKNRDVVLRELARMRDALPQSARQA